MAIGAEQAAAVARARRQWALYLAIERHPDLAARLRHLEARAAHITDPEEGRAVVAEIGRILDRAAAEAADGGAPGADR
ncbi:hypothetical protein [Streptomyces sp. NPDC090022]|uniref:hypothetical protein n=1 Tax=Streptomyces sp. NPDC090022 TaxID=3365920 RepID=UPI00382524F7